MTKLIMATLITCLGQGIDNNCQYREVQIEKDYCKTGAVEMKLPKGSTYDKYKVVTVCKG